MSNDESDTVQLHVKRQKVLHKPQHGDSHPSSPCMIRQSCDMEYWVVQLNQTRPEQVDTLIAHITSIRSQIPKRGDLVPTIILRRLYQCLMLHMGYTSSWLEEEADRGRLMLVQSLVFCFKDLVKYLFSVDIHHRHAILTPEDLSEIFTLIPQMVLVLYDSSKVRKIATCDDTTTHQVVSACRRIMVTLLRLPGCSERLFTTGMTQDVKIKMIMYSLLAGAACEGVISGNDDVWTVLRILQTTPTASSEVRSFSLVAGEAMHMATVFHKTGLLWLPKEYGQRSTAERVFFWKCTSYLYGSSMPEEVADRALDELSSSGKLSTNCRESVSNVRDFVPHASSNSCLNVIEAVYESLLDHNDHGYSSTKTMGILNCIDSCLSREDGSKLVLDVIGWPKLFHFLMLALSTDGGHSPLLCQEQIQHDQYNTGICETAAKIAIPLLHQVLVQSPTLEEDTNDFERFIVTLLAVLKSSSSSATVEEALDLLFAALDDKILQRRIACGESRDLAHALASVVSDDSLSGMRKGGLTKALSILIQERRCARFISREPKILEFLIYIAGGRNGTQQEQDRGTAVRSLLRLATNPCDRRMLAKMPGLLSSIIRYVRSTSTVIEGSDDGTGYSRDEMKKQIFLLAEAL